MWNLSPDSPRSLPDCASLVCRSTADTATPEESGCPAIHARSCTACRDRKMGMQRAPSAFVVSLLFAPGRDLALASKGTLRMVEAGGVELEAPIENTELIEKSARSKCSSRRI